VPELPGQIVDAPVGATEHTGGVKDVVLVVEIVIDEVGMTDTEAVVAGTTAMLVVVLVKVYRASLIEGYPA
jgi:hypothetical protein